MSGKIRYVRGEKDDDSAAGSGEGDHGEGCDRTAEKIYKGKETGDSTPIQGEGVKSGGPEKEL